MCRSRVYDGLTEDWTNDIDGWIGLNFRFYRANHIRIVYMSRIAVAVSHRCSPCWVLKIRPVESRGLGCQ